MQTSNRKNLYILAFTLAVVMLGFGTVIPIMPFYVERLGAGGTELGLLVASYAVMRLICGPIWGTLSDRVGRKPVLMIGIFGYGITMILFGLATQLWMLFVFRILSGILSSATSPTTMAYIGDSTSEQDRGQGMGVLGAAVGVGTIVGPGLGGLLGGENLALPFFIAGGMSFLALLLIWLLLPESLPPEARQKAGEKKRPQVREMLRALSSSIGSLLLMAFLASFGLTTFFGIFGLYALDKYSAIRISDCPGPRFADRAAHQALGRSTSDTRNVSCHCCRIPGHRSGEYIYHFSDRYRAVHPGNRLVGSSGLRINFPTYGAGTRYNHGFKQFRPKPGAHRWSPTGRHCI
jgi:multidrug resistance protein